MRMCLRAPCRKARPWRLALVREVLVSTKSGRELRQNGSGRAHGGHKEPSTIAGGITEDRACGKVVLGTGR